MIKDTYTKYEMSLRYPIYNGGDYIYTKKPLFEKKGFNKIDDGKRPYIVAGKPPLWPW